MLINYHSSKFHFIYFNSIIVVLLIKVNHLTFIMHAAKIKTNVKICTLNSNFSTKSKRRQTKIFQKLFMNDEKENMITRVRKRQQIIWRTLIKIRKKARDFLLIIFYVKNYNFSFKKWTKSICVIVINKLT